MEVSSVGLEEEIDEIELSLGLSIGGNFRKIPKLIPEDKKATNADTVPGVENQGFSGHSRAQALVGDSEAESRGEYVDPQWKREINSLRRQEAKRKREEKIRKHGLMIVDDFSDDIMCLEAQQRVQVRDRDGEMRENEANFAGSECKEDNNEEREGLTLTATHNGAQKLGQESRATGYGSIPVVPYPPLQFAPFTNGFAFPCVMPCLTPTSSNGGSKKNEGNVQQPLACRKFCPSHGGPSSGNLLMRGSDSEYNSGKDGTNRNAVSNGSLVCSSSVVSDNGSSPQQGSSSSDTGSDSSHLKPEQSQLNSGREHSVPSSKTEPTQVNSKRTNNTETAVPCGGTIQSSPTKLIKYNKLNTSQNPNPGPLREARDQGLDTHSLPQMPYVSTTGNGPNGKTITGFLYRYSKAEVSIVCVCHGSSFSPAEFVEHAGGKDITHPLRQITVITSAFG